MLQNEIARSCAEEIFIKNKYSRVRDILWILQLFIGQVRDKEEYQALVSVRDFPNYIWGRETVDRIIGGLLTKSVIRKQIIDFYEKGRYLELKEEIIKENYETYIPIWLVVHNNALDANGVYPVISNMDNRHKCIALVINEI